MWPFKRKPLLDAETADWHIDNFEWLTRNYAASTKLNKVRLVLPKEGFFPADGEQGHALALRIFARIKVYADINDWPVDLEMGASLQQKSRSLLQVRGGAEALGTFEAAAGNRMTIRYAPELLRSPQALIATLAHEVGHVIIASAPEEPICEPDEIEFLTDLAAVWLGFGVFLANTAFTFQQWRDDAMGTQGWSSERQGYLPENDLVFALALFLSVKQLDPTEAGSALKPHLASVLKKALTDLDGRKEEIGRIRAAAARTA